MTTSDFILLRCRGYRIVHGFDVHNQEILEENSGTDWVDKIIAVWRIQSVTEKYIRMSYSHNRVIYWEYEGGLTYIKPLLNVRS